jgi:hypothetical protein
LFTLGAPTPAPSSDRTDLGANTSEGSGAVYILFDSDSGVASTVKIGVDSEPSLGLASGDNFGSSVTYLGDLDGDNTADIAVGATEVDSSITPSPSFRGGDFNNRQGVLYVLFLKADGSVEAFQKISPESGLNLSGESATAADIFAATASFGTE